MATGPRTQRGRAPDRGRAVTHPRRAWLRSPRAAAYLRRAGQGGRPLPPLRALPAASALRLRPTLAARSRQPLLCTCVALSHSACSHVFPAAFALYVSSHQSPLCACALRDGLLGSVVFRLSLCSQLKRKSAAGRVLFASRSSRNLYLVVSPHTPPITPIPTFVSGNLKVRTLLCRASSQTHF